MQTRRGITLLFMFAAAVILAVSPCPSAISHAFPSGKDYVSKGLARFTVDPGQGEDVYCRSGGQDECRKYLTSTDGSVNMEGWSGRIVRNADARGRPGYTPRCGATSRDHDFRFFAERKSSEISFARNHWTVLSRDFFLIQGFPRSMRRCEEGNRMHENVSSSHVLRIARMCAFTITGFVPSSLVTWESTDKQYTDSFQRSADVPRNGRAKWEIRRSLLWHDWRFGLLT